MELDTKKEKDKLQAEIEQLTGQLQRILDQQAQLQGTRQQLMNELLKKQGFLEGLQGLEPKKAGQPVG